MDGWMYEWLIESVTAFLQYIIVRVRMNYRQQLQQASMKPLYSPRTTYSNFQMQLNRLTTNLAINIDKYILGFFKDSFEEHRGELTLAQFLSIGEKNLQSWQLKLSDRSIKLQKCLIKLFMEIDTLNHGRISWTQFNSLLIEKGLNLKSLRSHEGNESQMLKPSSISLPLGKHQNLVQKIVYMDKIKKLAYFCQESTQIEIYSMEGGTPFKLKPLSLSQQQLIVETMITKRNRQGGKENFKKEVAVASYKNFLLDMVYIEDPKYNMLITSSSDNIIRGWDLAGNLIALAKQPENEEEKMVHQFTCEIHTMTWDPTNEVLYCSGKGGQIYEWIIKTDSEKELDEGHDDMVSSMIMLPKLQILASGDYKGKLILWDTVSQSKKFVYNEHTKAIINIVFCDQLILLFTAAFDHSICVWNPYINTLIHKIVVNANAVQIDLVPGRNMLLMLDVSGNVKLYEISKFTLASTFSLEKDETESSAHNIQGQGTHKERTCIVAMNQPLRYIFGGSKMLVYDFVDPNQQMHSEGMSYLRRYCHKEFALYCPSKSNIEIWDILTGRQTAVFSQQTQGEITAFELIPQLKLYVLGDSDGNLQLRKMENGLLMRSLHKHKMMVNILLVSKCSWSEYLIFSVSEDGEIIVIGKELNSKEFSVLRVIPLRKMLPNSNALTIDFIEKKETLIVGTNMNELIFIDIDKNKSNAVCDVKVGEFFQIYALTGVSLLLGFTRNGEIFGLHLPPHSKKYQLAWLLSIKKNIKVSAIALNGSHSVCYIGTDSGDVMCFSLEQLYKNGETKAPSDTGMTIQYLWKAAFNQPVKDILLIESEDILLITFPRWNMKFIDVENGKLMNQIQPGVPEVTLTPVLFFKEETDEIYVPRFGEYVQLKTQTDRQDNNIRKVHDPFYYFDFLAERELRMDQKSNPKWTISPNIKAQVEKDIKEWELAMKEVQKLTLQPKKIITRSESVSIHYASRALKLQQHDKEEEEEHKEAELRLPKHHSFFNRYKYAESKYIGEAKAAMSNKQHNSSPNLESILLRLGVGLSNIDGTDKKAQKFMEMADKIKNKNKEMLKLPSIQKKNPTQHH